jgi:hypothetical protein
VKSKLVDQQLDRRYLEDLMAVRRFAVVGQVEAAAVAALLRIVILDCTTSLRRK